MKDYINKNIYQKLLYIVIHFKLNKIKYILPNIIIIFPYSWKIITTIITIISQICFVISIEEFFLKNSKIDISLFFAFEFEKLIVL